MALREDFLRRLLHQDLNKEEEPSMVRAGGRIFRAEQIACKAPEAGMSLSVGEITRRAMSFGCLECRLKVINDEATKGCGANHKGLLGKESGFCSYIMENYRGILRKQRTHSYLF